LDTDDDEYRPPKRRLDESESPDEGCVLNSDGEEITEVTELGEKVVSIEIILGCELYLPYFTAQEACCG
jgi:hypothetical protein